MKISEGIFRQRRKEFIAQRDKRLRQVDAAAEGQKAGWQLIVDFYNDLIAVCDKHIKQLD